MGKDDVKRVSFTLDALFQLVTVNMRGRVGEIKSLKCHSLKN